MIAIETKQITRTFGDFTAVDKIDLAIEKGRIYGFLGPNGSGKSTTIRMLCGLLEPTSGSGTVLGFDLSADSDDLKRRIGYMSQRFSLYDDLSARQNLDFYAGLYGVPGKTRRERIQEMLDLAGIAGQADALAGTLSGGYKQRLALGAALLHHPELVFLDEPTGGVDPKARRRFWEIIYRLSQEGVTVMVTTHFMDEAEHCDRIGFIFNGKLLAEDTPGGLKKQLPGSLWEIPSANPMELVKQFAEAKDRFLDVYPFGSGVHVLTDADGNGQLASLGGRKIEPTLEDVFVYFVKTGR